MRVLQYLEQTRQMPLATRSELTGNAPIIVLSPHPDDETLGAGGLIRQATTVGQQIDIVVLTDGAGSHTHSVKYPASELVQLRKAEVIEAAAILGLKPEQLHHFDLPDAGLPKQGSAFEKAVTDVASIIEKTNAKTVFVTWGHDPHCDHEAASKIAKAAVRKCPGVRLFAYPIWGWHLDPNQDIPGEPHGYRLNISAEQATKCQAIAAHRSQMTGLIDEDPSGFRFTPETLAPFLSPFEFFYELDGNGPV